MQPTPAQAYESQVSLSLAGGWALAPALEGPNNGPAGALSMELGFDDTWGLGIYGGWGVHPAFTTGEPLHLGAFGAEALYYVDILQIVPFFGVGLDALPSYDGTDLGIDFAAHLRLSADYLIDRHWAVGLDVRPYVRLTALSTDPFYLTFFLRISVLLDY